MIGARSSMSNLRALANSSDLRAAQLGSRRPARRRCPADEYPPGSVTGGFPSGEDSPCRPRSSSTSDGAVPLSGYTKEVPPGLWVLNWKPASPLA